MIMEQPVRILLSMVIIADCGTETHPYVGFPLEQCRNMALPAPLTQEVL